MVESVSKAQLELLKGKTMKELCPHNHYDNPNDNHCAHFVSHTLGMAKGKTCGDVVQRTVDKGASIRCNELYNALTQRGPWDDKQARDGILIFATSTGNMLNGRMQDSPQKHVGILFGGTVYNYHNPHAVGTDDSVAAFVERLRTHYNDKSVTGFYAVPE